MNQYAVKVHLIKDKPKVQTVTEKKPEYKPGEERPRVIIIGDAKPFSFEAFKKTIAEKKAVKEAKKAWRNVMRLEHDGWVKRKTFGKYNQKSDLFTAA